MNSVAFDFSHLIVDLVAKAAKQAGIGEGFQPDVKPADPRFGDFQANGILPFAKSQKKNPRELAIAVLKELQAMSLIQDGSITVEIAGPGFINFKLQGKLLSTWLARYGSMETIKADAAQMLSGEAVVVDFSSPNTAKEMHVGHIRSTVIGEAICRLLEFCGAKVIRDNHIGDWGTQFGMLILAIKTENCDLDAISGDPIAELERLYKKGSAMAKENETDLEHAREELVKLQNGDEENTALWKKINDISYRSFDDIYKRLGVHFDYVYGESFYRDKVQSVYDELTQAKLAEESEGALVVFHLEHPRFNTQPFIIRKRDGASNYATTDLATIDFRVKHFHPSQIVYLTDARQSDHFEQLFLTAEKWFSWRKEKTPQMRHVTFGTILGEDGKAIKTRSGESVKLKDLINEGIERSYKIISDKNPDWNEEERRHAAEVIGVNAIRYADLMQNRSSDYVFSWDKLLSFEGNTAPYMLYAVVRVHSIFRKVNLEPTVAWENAAPLETEQEFALARKLIEFPVALSQALQELRPHFLCTYLYDLAGTFSTFYNQDKVNVDDTAIRNKRLSLCANTLVILKTGLEILGIPTLERM